MKNLLKKIKMLRLAIIGKPVAAADIIKVQQDLKLCGFPVIPTGYTELLHYINALEYNGCFLYGVRPQHFRLDIFAKNVSLNLPMKESILVLGEDEFSWLCYDSRRENYSILDKESFHFCRCFKNPVSAVGYILKIEEERPLF